MKKMKVVTSKRLQRAVNIVVRELITHGLWTSKLADVQVYLVPFGASYGWVLNRDGNVYIPCVSVCRILTWYRGQYVSLLDIVRHEYAHSFGYWHPERVDVAAFRKAFGARRENSRYLQKYDEDGFVTRYAATRPEEDLAETWMVYLKHKGVAPRKWKHAPAILRKWNFVRDLARRNRRKEGY